MRLTDVGRGAATAARRRLGRVPTAWSVGLVRGPSVDELVVSEPVLAPGFGALQHLSLVADPFFVAADGRVHLYVEAVVGPTGRGEIHQAVLEGGDVEYLGPSVTDDVHLSFPYVFRDPTADRYCMIPESCEALEVRLYASAGPAGPWTLDRVLLAGRPFVDTIAFERGGCWYLVTESSGGRSDRREVHVADSLDGEFEPVAELALDPARCRLAGRWVELGDGAASGVAGCSGAELRLLSQDCSAEYGRRISVETIGPWPAGGGPPTSFATTPHHLLGPDANRWFHSKVHGLDLRVGPGGVVGVVDGKGRLARRPVVRRDEIASFVAAANGWAGIDLP